MRTISMALFIMWFVLVVLLANFVTMILQGA
jgi:hypothetical protein